jgi:cysteine synthase
VANLTIYLPETVSEAKAEKLRRQGARLVLHGRDSVEAEREARAVAEAQGMTYISPYNDLKVQEPSYSWHGWGDVTCQVCGHSPRWSTAWVGREGSGP